MIELKAKLWRGVGLAALAVGALAACSPSGQGVASAKHDGAGDGVTTPPPTSAGGESGEAGANLVYDNLSPAERSQLRLQHLKGFLLIAKKELDAGHASEAGALIGQGKLEVYTPAATDFAGLNATAFDTASTALMDGKPNGAAALQTALSAVTAKQGAADAELVRRMLKITGGLYNGINGAEGVDPTEYQPARARRCPRSTRSAAPNRRCARRTRRAQPKRRRS